MSDALTSRLEELRQVMDRVAAPRSAPRPLAPVPAPAPSVAAPVSSASAPAVRPSRPGAASSRTELMDWLVLAVRENSGIAIENQVRAKLERIVANTETTQVAAWVSKLASLDPNHAEWLSLIEMLTVHETYFFRDPGQLEFLRRTFLVPLVAREKAKSSPTLRLWSAASSTGEEVYTVAMLLMQTLCEAGEATANTFGGFNVSPRWTISVMGSDISRPALRTAQNAVYQDFGLGPFRSMSDLHWRFFEQIQQEGGSDPFGTSKWFRVRPEIRALVSFNNFNLMAPDPPRRDFDVILCRNVLIYFDQAGKRQVLKMLHRALAPEAVLLLGPSDVPDDPTLFKTVWGSATVVHQKR